MVPFLLCLLPCAPYMIYADKLAKRGPKAMILSRLPMVMVKE